MRDRITIFVKRIFVPAGSEISPLTISWVSLMLATVMYVVWMAGFVVGGERNALWHVLPIGFFTCLYLFRSNFPVRPYPKSFFIRIKEEFRDIVVVTLLLVFAGLEFYRKSSDPDHPVILLAAIFGNVAFLVFSLFVVIWIYRLPSGGSGSKC